MLARAEFWSKEHHQSAEKIAAHYSAAFQRVAFSDFLRRFEVYRQQGRILDLGCGIGGFIHAEQQAGWEAYGVDISL
jgi:SAM-dependent methyltransferase